MKKYFVFLPMILLVLALTACNGINLEDALDSIELPEEVTSDIALPTLNDEYADFDIVFDSQNDAVISDTGEINPQAEDVLVDIIITVSNGEKTVEKTVQVTVLALSPEEILTKALTEITFPDSTTEDISFDTLTGTNTIFDDVSYVFTSSEQNIISDEGVVTQSLVDQEVDITVTASLDGKTDSKTVTVLVPKREKTDAEIVADAKENFTLPFTEVTTSVLLTETFEDTTVTYSSSNADVFTSDGTVVRPYIDDVVVTLTATFTKGDAEASKSFEVTVKGLPADEIPVSLDATYTLTQTLDTINADVVFTYSGTVSYVDPMVDKTVELVLFYQDDTVLDTISTTTSEGAFSLSISVNEYNVGWDWYKFKVNVIEGEYRKDNILIPFDSTSKEIGVLEGVDGDVRYFESVDNNGYVNISMSGVEDENKTDFMKVLADYHRLTLPQSEFINQYTLPADTGQWGQTSNVSWSIEENMYASVSDHSLEITQSSPDMQTLTLTATISNGTETLEKTFEITVIKASISFNQNEAVWQEIVSDNHIDLHALVSGNIINENELAVSLELEVYITLEDNDVVLMTYQNLSENTDLYSFDVNISELDLQGEWGKVRIKANVDGEIIYFAYEDDSITLPNDLGTSYQNDLASYFSLGNQWGMFYIEPKTFVISDASTENITLTVENDRVYLNVSGYVLVDSEVTLTIKNDSNIYENTLDDLRNYVFKIDVTDLDADGDWRDIHIHYVQTIDTLEVANDYIDIYAPWDVKDALNVAYQVTLNGKTYAFAEWASNLKIVINNE